MGSDYLERVHAVPAELTLGTLAKSEGLEAPTVATRMNALLRENSR